MIVVSADRLRSVISSILLAAGAPEENAAIVTDHLVDANLCGYDSHGVIQLPGYVQAIQRGTLDPAAKPALAREMPTAALVDGNLGFGQVCARYATALAVRKAREVGIALVGVVRCGHIGRLGEYVEMAARGDTVAFVTVGGVGDGNVAPYGGKHRMLGTNPIAIGFPAGERPALMVDFATSGIAGAKAMVAMAKGERVPPGTLLDREGNPTTDPAALFYGGALTPAAGHKGYALAVASALLSTSLTGAETYEQGAGSAFIIAIHAGILRPIDDVKRSADRAFGLIKSVPPAPGFEEVLIPGEPELVAREVRRREGIPVAEATWAELRSAATGLGVHFGGY